MEQFKNIQTGSTVYWLDKNALVTGNATVKSVIAPHIQTVPTVSSSLVIDVTLSIDGVDKLYTMPDTATVAYAGDLVLATDRDSLIAECGKMKEEAEGILAKVDKCNAVIDKYDNLILSLKPEEAERRDMNDRLSKLEDSVAEILSLLKK